MTVTSDPDIPIRPVESDVSVTCTVELSPAVDVPVSVNTVWTGPDGFMTTVTAQHMGSTTAYTSTIMVTSFGREKFGNYSCTASISSDSLLTSETKVGSLRITSGKIDLNYFVLQITNTHTCTVFRSLSIPQRSFHRV